MDEYIEKLDFNGSGTGKKILKSEAHKNGILHSTIHLWCIQPNGNVLFQKRHSQKENFPDYWDVSVAGHISFGEEPLEALRRECKEEIGLKINLDQLHSIGTFYQKHFIHSGFIDNEKHYVYLYVILNNELTFVLQKSEVSAVKWFPLSKIYDLSKNNIIPFVPHSPSYFKWIFDEINKLLTHSQK